MEGILTEIANSGYDCYMVGVCWSCQLYRGSSTFNPYCLFLHQMAHICDDFAKRYDITFTETRHTVWTFKKAIK